MFYYAIETYNNTIKIIEFVRVTECFGFRPDGRRESLNGYNHWSPTREQAIEHRRSVLASAVEYAQKSLAHGEKMLDAFNALYPETGKSHECGSAYILREPKEAS